MNNLELGVEEDNSNEDEEDENSKPEYKEYKTDARIKMALLPNKNKTDTTVDIKISYKFLMLSKLSCSKEIWKK